MFISYLNSSLDNINIYVPDDEKALIYCRIELVLERKFITMRRQKNHKTYIIVMASLIVLCELLLKIDNKIVQSFGILLLPVIIVTIFKFMINDQKREID